MNDGLDSNKIQIGHMILDEYPNPTYYGIVCEKTEEGYYVEWYDSLPEFCHKDYYPFKVVTGLTDNRIISDKKQQLAIRLRLK